MQSNIIDGKKLAADLNKETAKLISQAKQQSHITPTLAVILVGNDPASEVYVRNKETTAHLVGMNSLQFKFTAEISEEELLEKIKKLNSDANIHGILVQLPLPAHINSLAVISAIDPNKDVDGFHINNVGKLTIGDKTAIVPCTALACIEILKHIIANSNNSQKINSLVGLKVLVIGASNIVGLPVARMLLANGCTITIANRSTKDLKSACLNAEAIIVAAGSPKLLKADMINEGTIIIDVGINRIKIENGKTAIVGDVDFDAVSKVSSAITPVPGGVGPMTIACLLKNTMQCYQQMLANSNLTTQ
jgi:methylenetetrahydrofolate dehydrogenase (NADP+)/methenyltetrahydrofolate cyclohydrolase